MSRQKEISEATAEVIDAEVRTIIDNNYQKAYDVLKKHQGKLHAMAEALIKYETIDEVQIKDIMDDKPPRPPEG